MAATINDVAKMAGVSITTVSRVLNNNYPVKEETRQKINDAIEKLNYKPNIAARSLITKKTFMIGVLVPGITNLFFPTIVEAIEQTVKKYGYSISLCNTGGDFESEKVLIDEMISRQLDGIIAIDPTIENLDSGYFDEISKTTPLIVVNGSPQNSKCNFICYDEKSGTKEAFKYLIELGHKKIAFLRGHRSFSYDLKEKIYKDVIKKEGLSYEKVIDAGMGNSIEVVERVRALLMELFSQPDIPTAIFACNDLMALGSINACSNAGLKIPEDMSIIGFDNTLLSQITSPSITSVDQNMAEVGRMSAERIVDMIDKEKVEYKVSTLPTKLIIRESTGKCNRFL